MKGLLKELKKSSSLKYYRIEAGLTQQELANLADTRKSYIGSLERLEHTPQFKKAVAISKALNKTIDDVFKEFIV